MRYDVAVAPVLTKRRLWPNNGTALFYVDILGALAIRQTVDEVGSTVYEYGTTERVTGFPVSNAHYTFL
jgi:hypothetical protein